MLDRVRLIVDGSDLQQRDRSAALSAPLFERYAQLTVAVGLGVVDMLEREFPELRVSRSRGLGPSGREQLPHAVTKDVRAWARARGIRVPATGSVPRAVVEEYLRDRGLVSAEDAEVPSAGEQGG